MLIKMQTQAHATTLLYVAPTFFLSGESKTTGTGNLAPGSASCSYGRGVRVVYKIPSGVSIARKQGIARTSK